MSPLPLQHSTDLRDIEPLIKLCSLKHFVARRRISTLVAEVGFPFIPEYTASVPRSLLAIEQRCLELQLHLPGGVVLHPFVRQRRSGDVAAQLFQPLAVVCFDPDGSVQAESVDSGCAASSTPTGSAATALIAAPARAG